MVHNSKIAPAELLASIPLWLVKSEDQKPHSYFLKASFTEKSDPMNSMLQWGGGGGKEGSQKKSIQNSTVSRVRKNGKWKREGERKSERSAVVGVTAADCWASVWDRLWQLSKPHPFVHVYACIFV